MFISRVYTQARRPLLSNVHHELAARENRRRSPLDPPAGMSNRISLSSLSCQFLDSVNKFMMVIIFGQSKQPAMLRTLFSRLALSRSLSVSHD